MIRISRALKETTAHAARFVSLLALAACGSSDDGSAPTEPGSFQGQQLPTTTTPAAPSTGEQPAGTGTTTTSLFVRETGVEPARLAALEPKIGPFGREWGERTHFQGLPRSGWTRWGSFKSPGDN